MRFIKEKTVNNSCFFKELLLLSAFSISCAASSGESLSSIKDEMFSGSEGLEKNFLRFIQDSGESYLKADEQISYSSAILVRNCLNEVGQIKDAQGKKVENLSVKIFRAEKHNMVEVTHPEIYHLSVKCFMQGEEVIEVK